MRWAVAVESAAGLAAGAAIADVYPVLAGSSNGPPALSVRRLVVGGYGTATVQQMSVTVSQANEGGALNSFVLQPLDSGAQAYSANLTLGRASTSFSPDPTAGGEPLYELTFSTVGGSAALAWDRGEFVIPYLGGGGLSMCLYNTGAAAPSTYLFTASFEVELI